MSRGVWIIEAAASVLFGALSGMTAVLADLSCCAAIAIAVGATALAAAAQIVFPQAPAE
jgi:hypothetical protein